MVKGYVRQESRAGILVVVVLRKASTFGIRPLTLVIRPDNRPAKAAFYDG